MENRNFKSYKVQDLVNKKRKRCDKNINKSKTSPAGVEQAKENNGSSLKLLTEHCVAFLLPSFFSHFAKMLISSLA